MAAPQAALRIESMSGNQFNHEVSDVGAPLEIPVGSGRRNNPLSLAWC